MRRRRTERELREAWRGAKALMIPPQHGGRRWGDWEWRMARAQWLYDHVSKRLGEAELKEMNMLRQAYDHDKPGDYPPLDLKR